jgi:hypothetical protein
MDSSGAISPLKQKYGVRGIPHSFVIAEGRIQYSGHPMQPQFESTIQTFAQKATQAAKAARLAALTEDSIRAMSIGELKTTLRDLGLSAAGCLEKSDLVQRVLAHRPSSEA